ncbi:MAG: hypothetical protein FJ125_16360 [Deltaproteobacteria bacterium]|nr:hypothetical protein [Deltaproteobacteria bacterium]
MSRNTEKLARRGIPLLAALAGAGVGAAYSLTIGCITGGCPITSNPWLSAGVGGLLAFILANGFAREGHGAPGPVEQGAEEEASPGGEPGSRNEPRC